MSVAMETNNSANSSSASSRSSSPGSSSEDEQPLAQRIQQKSSSSSNNSSSKRRRRDSDASSSASGSASESGSDYKPSPPPQKKQVSKPPSSSSSTNNNNNKRKSHHGGSYADGNSSSEDDLPLAKRKIPATAVVKKEIKSDDSSDEDDLPLAKRKSQIAAADMKNVKIKKEEIKVKKEVKKEKGRNEKDKKKKNSSSNNKSKSSSASSSPTKRVKKEEPEEEIWRWWEEKPRDSSHKWNFLEHKGPLFAPDYEPLPSSVHFRYDGKVMKLSRDAEEVAGFYARFVEHEYSTKDKFRANFFKDWTRTMTRQERETIKDLSKCDFVAINDYFKQKSEERKAMSKEEKTKIKEEKEAIAKEYGYCIIDGHKEKIGNFNIEPPGLFRGRGDHPKMGRLKKRIVPEDVIINCSKDSKVPKPPAGHKWKEVRHDNTVSWLAGWTENVQGNQKYVMLNATSRLKGEKDWLKYEKARQLGKHIEKIRRNYMEDWKSREMKTRQRAVALYFIDRLALRAGNEKDEDQADTVGCCSLRFEHIKLFEKKEVADKDEEFVVQFDFPGKDSIRYFNEVPVEKRVFKNLKLFMENKRNGDDLFDRLNTAILNDHLRTLMDGLSAKVFRTYNASHTLQEQLNKNTTANLTPAEKLLVYNRANRAVAVLCNHQRAPPKSFEKSVENLMEKIKTKKAEVKNCKKELKALSKGSAAHDKKKAQLARLDDQLKRLEMNKTDKEEGKEIALGTSKLNYLDPRISIAWCKKFNVPIEKVYNKTLRAKFRWAIDMADKHFQFDN